MKKALDVLNRSLGKGKLAHSYLAPARRGVDLTRYGRSLAAEIICDEKESSCWDKVEDGLKPDVIEVTPANVKLSIDQIREVKNSASRSPVDSERKVYVINKAEDLSLQAANSLLKILEAPPDYVVFFLLSYNPSEVPPTVTSRCQRLPRGGLSREDLRDVIGNYTADETEVDYVMGVVNEREDLLEKLDLQAGDQLERGRNLREKFEDEDPGSVCDVLKDSEDLIESHEAARRIFYALPEMGDFELLELAEELGDLEREELSDFLRKGIYIYRKGLLSSSEGSPSRFQVKYTYLDRLRRSLGEVTKNVNSRLLLEAVFLGIKEE